MTTMWQPFTDFRSEMNRLQNEMERLFGRSESSRGFSRSAYPPLNLWEDDNALYVEAELPGFDLVDLEVQVTGENQLSLKGERKAPEHESGKWHRRERGHGRFSRLTELPNDVDNEKVTADFQHGVLTITLPKREEIKPRKIEVRVS